MMPFKTRDIGDFRFIDEGPESGTPVVLFHGMLGGVDNWDLTIEALVGAGYRAVAPLLPVYSLPMEQTSVAGLASYAADFLDHVSIQNPVLVGNSLGGHVALMLAIHDRRTLSGLVLTGASGIHEVFLGNSKLRRDDRNYIKEKAALTFHDPVHVTDDLVDEVIDVVMHRPSALRLIKIARSAKKDTVRDHLSEIRTPSLLIWGRQDRLTPPEVASDFQRRMGNARLEFIDRCGHAPMIEHPNEFARLLVSFLDELEHARPSPETTARGAQSA